MQKRFAPPTAPSRNLWAVPVLLLAATLPQAARAGTSMCDGTAALGVSRIIEIDAGTGGLYGSMSPRANHHGILRKKEVALTFDDGPMPWITKSILDTLDKACVKATFFSVGRMAIAYPATSREVLARGHTLGTHTFSHPFNMPRMAKDKAQSEIENGFAAVATAAGAPIAPFFRFTGLNDSAALIDYLGSRRIAAFTVDVVSNDSYIHDVAELTKRTLAQVEARQGGIILFHDIKTTTAKALPGILAELKARGYSIVHFVAKAPAEPKLDLMANYAPKVAKLVAEARSGNKTMLPFYGAVGPDPVKASVPGQAAAPELRPAIAAARDRGDAFKGGLDLSQKPNGNHPGTTAFASGYPAHTAQSETGDESSTATHSQAAPAPKLFKGTLWDAMETWAAALTGAQSAPAKAKD